MAKKIDKKKVDKTKKPVGKSARPMVKKAAAKPAKAAVLKRPAAKPVAKKAAPPAATKKPAGKGASAPVKAAAAPAKVAAAPSKVAVVKKSGLAKAPPVEKVVTKKSPEKSAAKPTPAPAVAKPVPERVAKKSIPKAPQVEEPSEEVLEADTEIEEPEESDEVVLTDAEGRRYCRVKDCDQVASVDGYCRYHYLLFWKKIQVRKKILTEGKLERYIEELTARYPDKFLEMLRKDLRSDKEFLAAIAELEIDESAAENEFEDEAQNYIDEVRGMGEPAARDDEGDF